MQSWYEKHAYIITQGVRTKAASVDFWRLVWESDTNCIVMLTKVFLPSPPLPSTSTVPPPIPGLRLHAGDVPPVLAGLGRTGLRRCPSGTHTDQDLCSLCTPLPHVRWAEVEGAGWAQIIRTFKLSRVNKEGVGAPRIVTQFHFIEWELDSFPYISAFLELRRRIRKYLAANPSPGPIVVHCRSPSLPSAPLLEARSH